MSKKTQKVVLALGEGSHSHILHTLPESEAHFTGSVVKLMLKEDSPVVHEEHGPIVIPGGRSCKVPQMEHDYTTGLRVELKD